MEIGTNIGPYRIDGLLGKGGMAEVYKAWHTGLHRFEAMKVLPPQMTFDKSFVARFLNEARNVAGLHHPNIAVIHSVSDADCPHPYFTMELVEGGDLSDLLEARGVLPLSEMRPILEQIAAALDYAHSRGLIHRDVKPANVLLKPEGENRCSVKLVDFGIARAQEESGGTRMTKTGMIVGTPEYMSPEQAGSGAPVDHRTDIYALGIIAYEVLCGRPPFKAESDTSMLSVIMQHVRDEPRPPIEYSQTLPKAANAAILKALAKDPAQRFNSCGEFIAALFSSTPVAIPKTASVPKKSSPLMPMLVGAALFGGVGLFAMGVLQSGKSTSSSNAVAPSVAPTPVQEASTPTLSPTKPALITRFSDVTATASKSVKAKGYDYGPALVLDGRHDTAWNVDNSHHGIGEWIQLSWPGERTVTKIGAVVGYDKYNYKPYYSGQPHMWFRNNRLKQATLRFSGGEMRVVSFADKTGVQMKEFAPVRAGWVRLMVDEVYLDMYGGRQKRWDDLAIAEIQVWGHS